MSRKSFIKLTLLLPVLILLPLSYFGQIKQTLSKTELSKIYCLAISDFIKTANKNNKTKFDTLFFGKRVNGQADDFPDITLPKIIEKTQIQVISPDLGALKQESNKSSIYINLMGWIVQEDAEFIFVVFSNGFKHQYDYVLNYTFDLKSKRWKLIKLEFKALL